MYIQNYKKIKTSIDIIKYLNSSKFVVGIHGNGNITNVLKISNLSIFFAPANYKKFSLFLNKLLRNTRYFIVSGVFNDFIKKFSGDSLGKYISFICFGGLFLNSLKTKDFLKLTYEVVYLNIIRILSFIATYLILVLLKLLLNLFIFQKK